MTMDEDLFVPAAAPVAADPVYDDDDADELVSSSRHQRGLLTLCTVG